MHRTFSLLLLGSCLLLPFSTLSSTEAPSWPKGIDPATLDLNTTQEPNLDSEDFVSLFNGHDLNGWTVRGSQMKFEVIDGEIVGTCTPELKPNSFLCTDKIFSNFIFTAEFKWDIEGNSGIMFRADTKENDRVFGYQSEMDPSKRGWTGGIYGEAMDGWLYPLSKPEHDAARAALQSPNEWSRMTISAQGSTIKTWINGIPCASLIDSSRIEGFFGLQVHQGDQGTIRWRNIKVKELPTTGENTNLFESNDFSQWTQVDGSPVNEGWTITGGTISRIQDNAGDIITREHYKNFDLSFEWKISKTGNSGIKYRTHGKLGLEYQILDDARHPDGKIVTHRSADLYDLLAARTDKPINPVGEWNTGRILVKGNNIQHWLNGEKVTEIEYGSEQWIESFEKSKYRKNVGFGSWTGPILLQDHGDNAWYRNLTIKPL